MRYNLRYSHPNLFKSIITFACINIGLGLNFLLTNPTFNPYGIDKTIIGMIFLGLGLGKIVSLLVVYNMKAIRILMALEVAFMVFWGIGSSITFFQGRTSLQLFVLYIGIAVSETFLLLEPVVNPMTETKRE